MLKLLGGTGEVMFFAALWLIAVLFARQFIQRLFQQWLSITHPRCWQLVAQMQLLKSGTQCVSIVLTTCVHTMVSSGSDLCSIFFQLLLLLKFICRVLEVI